MKLKTSGFVSTGRGSAYVIAKLQQLKDSQGWQIV
jgi:hypothetical protein